MDEFREWCEYSARRGLPLRNVETLLATLCAMFANVHRSKGTAPSKPADFLRGS